jgi:hypothetical protein
MTQRRSNIPADGKVNIRASQKIFRDVEGPSDIPPAQKTATNIIRGLPGCEYSGASKILDGGFPNHVSRKFPRNPLRASSARGRNGGMAG